MEEPMAESTEAEAAADCGTGPGYHKRVLIVGAGIAGMQAALDIANSGYEAVLVDRLPSVGGHMHQLSETFPTLDCAQCILTPGRSMWAIMIGSGCMSIPRLRRSAATWATFECGSGASQHT
jgi:monoamine oxidase